MVSLLLVKIVHDSNIRQPNSQKISIQYLMLDSTQGQQGRTQPNPGPCHRTGRIEECGRKM